MKLRQNREIKKSIKIYRKEVFCGIVGILLISLIVFYTVLNSMENKRTLQVKNDVYSLGRERNETNIYNITINYPQLEDGIGLNIDINKVNSRNYSAPRLGYINFWSKQRKYNFCFIIALLRKVDNFSM